MSIRASVLLLSLLVGCTRPVPPPAPVAPPEAVQPAPAPSAAGGVVASANPLASEAGLAMLRAGGTAFDAAVATALVIGVVNAQGSGLGGGGFAVIRTADGAATTLDFREMAPTFFGPDTFAVEGRSSSRGPWSVGIPGEPAGLAELHRRGGRLPWAEVVEPARRIAAEGFPVGTDLGGALAVAGDRVLADPGLSADFAPGGKVLAEGDTCARPALSRTLEYLQVHGGDALYSGPLAVSIAGFLADRGVPWTPQEFATYRVREREPLMGSYRGHGVITMGPPSSGGIAALQTLGILAVAEHHAQPFGGLDWTRTLAGALRHAFADRAAYGGDPDFAELPLDALLDPALPPRLWAATPKSGPVPLKAAGLAGERGELAALVPDDSGTSHLSVIDGEGNAIALTTTVNLYFGSGLADPQTGIVLNDQMDDFNNNTGQPNAFGLVQGARNLPGPGHRPLSSMTPTLVVDPQGRVVLSVGGAGGPRIITSTLLTILGVLDRAEDAQTAVASPRLHHQWLPPAVLLDEGFPSEGRGLGAEGFDLQPYKHPARVHAAAFDPASGIWSGGADPRGGGSVAAWNP